jgi:hypothetical protein
VPDTNVLKLQSNVSNLYAKSLLQLLLESFNYAPNIGKIRTFFRWIWLYGLSSDRLTTGIVADRYFIIIEKSYLILGRFLAFLVNIWPKEEKSTYFWSSSELHSHNIFWQVFSHNPLPHAMKIPTPFPTLVMPDNWFKSTSHHTPKEDCSDLSTEEQGYSFGLTVSCGLK